MDIDPQWVAAFLSAPKAASAAARQRLLAAQEDAVPALVDVFYAGVTPSQGVRLLELTATIGGPDALALLRNVFFLGVGLAAAEPAIRHAAAAGLAANQPNLSPNEWAEVTLFLAG